MRTKRPGTLLRMGRIGQVPTRRLVAAMRHSNPAVGDLDTRETIEGELENVVAAFIENGGWGAEAAAPVARAVLETYYKKKIGQSEEKITIAQK